MGLGRKIFPSLLGFSLGFVKTDQEKQIDRKKSLAGPFRGMSTLEGNSRIKEDHMHDHVPSSRDGGRRMLDAQEVLSDSSCI